MMMLGLLAELKDEGFNAVVESQGNIFATRHKVVMSPVVRDGVIVDGAMMNNCVIAKGKNRVPVDGVLVTPPYVLFALNKADVPVVDKRQNLDEEE